MKNINLPKGEYILNDIDPIIVNLTIRLLRNLGVPIYESTKDFEPLYPYLVWDGEEIIQSKVYGGREVINSPNEFIDLFEKHPIKMKLNAEYDAVVEGDTITVGCQKFPVGVLRKLLTLIDNR